MKKQWLIVLMLVGCASFAHAEPSREHGLSLHMLPKRVAALSGQKWGLTVTLNSRRTSDTIQSAHDFIVYFKSLPPEVQENGVWIVVTNPDAYSADEQQFLKDVELTCVKEKISLFECRAMDLPSGWKKVIST